MSSTLFQKATGECDLIKMRVRAKRNKTVQETEATAKGGSKGNSRGSDKANFK